MNKKYSAATLGIWVTFYVPGEGWERWVSEKPYSYAEIGKAIDHCRWLCSRGRHAMVSLPVCPCVCPERR